LSGSAFHIITAATGDNNASPDQFVKTAIDEYFITAIPTHYNDAGQIIKSLFVPVSGV